MNNPTARRFAATIIGLTLACAPALASAQSVSASTTETIGGIQLQIRALLSQLSSLKQQMQGILGQSSSTIPWMNGSSTMPQMPWNNPDMGSSTPPMPPQGDMGSSTPPMHGGMGCPMIDQDLSVGSSGSDVSALQQFLSSLPGNLFPSGDVTGFFGPLTQQAVGMFQTQMGIASSSTGVVGPLTRGFFARGCPMGSGSAQGMMASSTMDMHPMMPWIGSSTSAVSPARPMRPQGPMGSTTAMWAQGTSSQPYWIKFATPNNPQEQASPAQGGPGWHGSVPPWQPNQ